MEFDNIKKPRITWEKVIRAGFLHFLEEILTFGGAYYYCFNWFIFLVQYLPRLAEKNILRLRLSASLFKNSVKWGCSFRGAFLFFRPRANFFPSFVRGRRKCASRKAPTQEQKTNRPKWWKLADSNIKIHFSLPRDKNKGINLFQNKTLRYSTRAKWTRRS